MISLLTFWSRMYGSLLVREPLEMTSWPLMVGTPVISGRSIYVESNGKQPVCCTDSFRRGMLTVDQAPTIVIKPIIVKVGSCMVNDTRDFWLTVCEMSL